MTQAATSQIAATHMGNIPITGIDVDIVKIAPKRTYSMGGQDFSGMKYHGLVVRVQTEAGIEGLGEVFITPGWYGPDSPGAHLWVLKQGFAPAIIGSNVFDTSSHIAKMDELYMANYWTKAALENALRDAAAKCLGRPLVDLLGGKVRDRFALVGGIGTDSPESMAETAREYVDRGFKTIKLKIGAPGNLDLDEARVRVVREEIGADIVIRTDANSVFGTDISGAIKLARRLERYDVEHFEQPLTGECIEGMARVREAIDIPLMADESLHSMRDMTNIIQMGAADIIKLKMAKNGGYQKCNELVALAKSAGIRVEMGNGIQTSIASLHELCLACTNPTIEPAGEFPGPDKLVSDILENPLQIVDGDAILPSGPGIGSNLDVAAFEACKLDLKAMFG